MKEVYKFVCVLMFLLSLVDVKDYVFHLKFITSLVFLILSLCQVGVSLGCAFSAVFASLFYTWSQSCMLQTKVCI